MPNPMAHPDGPGSQATHPMIGRMATPPRFHPAGRAAKASRRFALQSLSQESGNV